MRALLTKNLSGRKNIKGLADWMMDNTNGIPFYIQCLGRTIEYKEVDPLKKDGEAILWNSFLEEDAPLIFRAEIESLNNSEKCVLGEAALFDRFTYAMIYERVGRTVKNIGQWLSSLVDKGVLLNPERGTYHFADPIFQKYLSKGL